MAKKVEGTKAKPARKPRIKKAAKPVEEVVVEAPPEVMEAPAEAPVETIETPPEPKVKPFPQIGDRFKFDGEIASLTKDGVVTHKVENGVVIDVPTEFKSVKGHTVEPVSNEEWFQTLG